MNSFRKYCDDYLNQRTGTYEFRCRRYRAVANKMEELGFTGKRSDLVVDIGAGRCEFGAYLRHRFDKGNYLYVPFDGSIDGLDLEERVPLVSGTTFSVAIEFLEHLSRLSVNMYLEGLPYISSKGVVLTTPNPYVTDVLGMDRTHKTPITTAMLHEHGYETQTVSLFTETDDTILAWKSSSN